MVVAVAVAVTASGCAPSARDHSADAVALEGSFSALEATSASSFQDWRDCHGVVVGGQLYTDSPPEPACSLDQLQPHPLAGAGKVAFDSVRAALAQTGVEVLDAGFAYDSNGRVAIATFTVPCERVAVAWCRYIYYRPGWPTGGDEGDGPGVTTVPIASGWVWQEEAD